MEIISKISFKRVAELLPEDFDARILKGYAAIGLWESDETTACIEALASFPGLDWNAYLLNNPDVQASVMSPIDHFLRYGINEGRRLYATGYEPSSVSHASRKPLVSVVVPNYNNELYLEKCLGSLVNQSLAEIEIIVVDDCSTDSSLKIIKKFARLDRRIVVIEAQENKSLHMTRKAGVAAATAPYLMFLDSDDFYTPDACEKAYGAIVGKHDFVEFNFKIITPPNGDTEGDRKLAEWLNQGKPGVYSGHEIYRQIYFKHGLTNLISHKIFATPFIKLAFSEMEDGYLIGGEDNYEAAVFASQAKSAAKIDEYLYFYRRGVGTTSGKALDGQRKLCVQTVSTFLALHRFITHSPVCAPKEWLAEPFFRGAVKDWLKADNHTPGGELLGRMGESFGVLILISWVLGNYLYNRLEIARALYRDYQLTAFPREVKRIAILCRHQDRQIQAFIAHEAIALRERGFEPILLKPEPDWQDSEIPDDIRIFYFGKYNFDRKTIDKMLRTVDSILSQDQIDLVIHHARLDGDLLWLLLLLKMRRIPLLVMQHAPFYYNLVTEGTEYDLSQQREVLKCADSVLVSSYAEELYFRVAGVNAHYLPSFVERLPQNGAVAETTLEPRERLVAIGNLAEKTDNAGDCLHVLAELVKTWPMTKLVYINCAVEPGGGEREFLRLADHLGVRDSVSIASHDARLAQWPDEASICISTAWHIGFCIPIVFAASRGLPVVIYDLPTPFPYESDFIIKVPICDFKALAHKVSDLLGDPTRLNSLSVAARKAACCLSPSRHYDELERIITTYDKYSRIFHYESTEYNLALQTLAFLGSHIPPWWTK